MALMVNGTGKHPVAPIRPNPARSDPTPTSLLVVKSGAPQRTWLFSPSDTQHTAPPAPRQRDCATIRVFVRGADYVSWASPTQAKL